MLASHIVRFNRGHNEVRAEGKEKRVQWAPERFKFTHGSPVTISSFYANVSKHVHQDLQRMRKRKSSTRTPFAVKQREDIVTDLDNCTITYCELHFEHAWAWCVMRVRKREACSESCGNILITRTVTHHARSKRSEINSTPSSRFTVKRGDVWGV